MRELVLKKLLAAHNYDVAKAVEKAIDTQQITKAELGSGLIVEFGS